MFADKFALICAEIHSAKIRVKLSANISENPICENQRETISANISNTDLRKSARNNISEN